MFQNSYCQNCKRKLYKYDSQISDIYLNISKKYFSILSKIFSLTQENENFNNYSNEIIIKENIFFNKIILKVDNNIVSSKKISKTKSIQYITEVINFLIGTNKNYISFHASGLLINNCLFLFIGSSGSGKTTAITYLLKKNSSSMLFSDDRVFINKELLAIGLPNALSIKSGTKELMNIATNNLFGPFKKNKTENFWYYTVSNKKCNYILDLNKLNVYFINVKYDKRIENIVYSKLSNLEKIKLFIHNCYDISSNTRSSQLIIKEIINNSVIYQINYNDLNDLDLFINSLAKCE